MERRQQEYEAQQEHIAKTEEFIRRYGAGQRYKEARGRQKRGSDIDFLMEFEKSTYDNFFNLIVYLEKVFGRKVEIVTPDGVDSIRVPEDACSIRDSVVYA